MEHAFASEFTVGVEEELFLVTRRSSGSPTRRSACCRLIERSGRWEADHEAFACEVELRSPPVATPGEALAELAAARTSTGPCRRHNDGGGPAPVAELFDVQLVHQERYAQVEDSMRGLIKRTPECALHVHVGMPGVEAAVRGVQRPARVAACAPGPDRELALVVRAGLRIASARAAMVRAYPREASRGS